VQGATEDAGRIGLVIVVCGMAGSMIGGIVLDKTHAYKVRTQDDTVHPGIQLFRSVYRPLRSAYIYI